MGAQPWWVPFYLCTWGFCTQLPDGTREPAQGGGEEAPPGFWPVDLVPWHLSLIHTLTLSDTRANSGSRWTQTQDIDTSTGARNLP